MQQENIFDSHFSLILKINLVFVTNWREKDKLSISLNRLYKERIVK